MNQIFFLCNYDDTCIYPEKVITSFSKAIELLYPIGENFKPYREFCDIQIVPIDDSLITIYQRLCWSNKPHEFRTIQTQEIITCINKINIDHRWFSWEEGYTLSAPAQTLLGTLFEYKTQ